MTKGENLWRGIKEIEIVMGIITLIVMIASITFLIILAIVATRKNIHQTSGIKVVNDPPLNA